MNIGYLKGGAYDYDAEMHQFPIDIVLIKRGWFATIIGNKVQLKKEVQMKAIKTAKMWKVLLAMDDISSCILGNYFDWARLSTMPDFDPKKAMAKMRRKGSQYLVRQFSTKEEMIAYLDAFTDTTDFAYYIYPHI